MSNAVDRHSYFCSYNGFAARPGQLAAQRNGSGTAQRHERCFMPTHGGPALQPVATFPARSHVVDESNPWTVQIFFLIDCNEVGLLAVHTFTFLESDVIDAIGGKAK